MQFNLNFRAADPFYGEHLHSLDAGQAAQPSSEYAAQFYSIANDLFQKMEADFSQLFKGEGISEITEEEMSRIPKYSDIESDVEIGECEVIKLASGEKGRLNTIGVASCIAVCARGFDRDQNVYLGLFHKCVDNAEYVFEELIDKMTELGCEVETIKMYAAGGLQKFNDEEEDNIPGTYTAEKELLEVGKKYGLTSVCLHINKTEDDSIDVCITPNAVLYARASDDANDSDSDAV